MEISNHFPCTYTHTHTHPDEEVETYVCNKFLVKGNLPGNCPVDKYSGVDGVGGLRNRISTIKFNNCQRRGRRIDESKSRYFAKRVAT